MNQSRIIKSYETLDFTDDFLFCKILTSDLSLAKELLEIILNTEIREVQIAEEQKRIKHLRENRGVRLDVYLKDDENIVYDVEMQTTEEPDLGKRARYYQGMIDLNLLKSGKRYASLNKSFVIFILKHKPVSFPVNLPVYTFRYRCEENPAVELKDDAIKALVNAEGPTDGLSEKLRNFLLYIRDSRPRDAFTKRLADEVEKARESREWRTQYMTLGMKYDQFYDEGKAEGINIGRADEQKSIINSALDHGMTPEDITKVLNVPENVVKHVLEERNCSLA